MSHADRELTVDKAVTEAGLTGTDWDLTTSSTDDGQGKRKLMDHSSRLSAWHWKEETIIPTTTMEGDDLSTITGFDQGAEQGSGQGESQPADGKGKDSQTPSQSTSTWSKQILNGMVVKVFFGITQFERRLGPPDAWTDECLPTGLQEVPEKVLGTKMEDPDPHRLGKAGQSSLLQTSQLPHRHHRQPRRLGLHRTAARGA